MWVGSAVGGVISWKESSPRPGLHVVSPASERVPEGTGFVRSGEGLCYPAAKRSRVDELKDRHTPLAGGSTYLVLGPVPVRFPLQVDTPSHRVGPEDSPGSLRITCHPEASVTPCPRTPCQIETSWQLLLVGAVLHLKKDCGRKEDEKGTGVNQLQAPTCCGKWKLPAKVQTTLKMIRHSRKLVLLANDCPVLRKSGIEDGAMLAKTGIHHYSRNNIELSTACGKYHRIRSPATIDPGVLVSLEACRNRWVKGKSCKMLP
ncbi:uncharacterized protein LOC116570249 isoform X1 [Mustela erminea]|uniref:uncharacterized protein LOC116570249 isoform X1 n=1 Tax=Mustela erminea TaxID=36723 RepID=UPI0013870FAE|nr:uncharacterized protein LOC116570249 isoform X1 [Mustela erminea]